MTTAEQSEPLRIAVLSLAHPHGYSYLADLARRPDVEVVLADPDGAGAPGTGLRGAAAAEAAEIPYHATYAEALADEPDGVVVTAENAQHLPLVRLAARPGVHILCEKPLGTTYDDAAAVVQAAGAAGARLMTAYPVRFSPTFGELKARVRAGEIGRVIAVLASNNGYCPVDARPWFTDPAQAGGGVLLDHVVHCADLLDDLLGPAQGPVHAVANTLLHRRPDVQVETGGLVTAHYPGGVLATIDCSWSHAATAPNWGGVTFNVLGTEGELRIEPFASHVGGFDRTGAAWLDTGPDLDALMLDEFVSSIRERRQPVPDGEAGLRTMQVVQSAVTSWREARTVVIP